MSVLETAVANLANALEVLENKLETQAQSRLSEGDEAEKSAPTGA